MEEGYGYERSTGGECEYFGQYKNDFMHGEGII